MAIRINYWLADLFFSSAASPLSAEENVEYNGSSGVVAAMINAINQVDGLGERTRFACFIGVVDEPISGTVAEAHERRNTEIDPLNTQEVGELCPLVVRHEVLNGRGLSYYEKVMPDVLDREVTAEEYARAIFDASLSNTPQVTFTISDGQTHHVNATPIRIADAAYTLFSLGLSEPLAGYDQQRPELATEVIGSCFSGATPDFQDGNGPHLYWCSFAAQVVFFKHERLEQAQ